MTMWSAAHAGSAAPAVLCVVAFPEPGNPQSYLAAVQASGLRLLYHADTSTYTVRFYTRVLTVYLERRAEFEALRGSERYQEGLERLRMSQHLATTGILGQFACIVEKPTGV
jgi:hypothetical protein